LPGQHPLHDRGDRLGDGTDDDAQAVIANGRKRSARRRQGVQIIGADQRDRPAAPASLWQNGVAERLIGSVQRECVDHITVSSEAHLRRSCNLMHAIYHSDIRTHRSLDNGAPVSRPLQGPESSVRMRRVADFTITTSGVKFSRHTAVQRASYMMLETVAPISDNPVVIRSAVPE
jgi:hypothetical protein